MTRKSRNDLLPVVVGSKSEGETEGLAPLQEGRGTHLRYVRRFDPEKDKLRDAQKVKQFTAIAKLLALSSGQKVDFSLVQEGFRALVADAFPAAEADLISAKQREGWALATSGNPLKWCERWVPALFNRAIKTAQLVMWAPDGGSFGPAIFCPDTETALYATLLIGRSFDGLRACLGCGVLFPSRTNKLYHDNKCGDRQRHKRAKLKKAKEK
jgi:hypothetical protein